MGSGIAVNSTSHDVYVADTGNARVDEFSSSGTFVRAWGWGVADGLPMFETCALFCEKGISGTGTGQFTTPTFIAVDNSTGSSANDVYVGDSGTNLVSKFSSTGVFLSSNNGSTAPHGPFGELGGVAVDSGGDLWVYASTGRTGNMFEFAPGGGFITEWNSESTIDAVGIAVDPSTNLYIGSFFPGVAKFSRSGTPSGLVEENSVPTGIGVDPFTGDLYVDEGSTIRHYLPSCEPANGPCTAADSFGNLQAGAGVGVDSSSNVVYVAEAATDKVDSFAPAILPDVTTGAVSQNTTGTGVTLNGSVNADGIPVTSCEFEYGTSTSYGQTATCSPEPAGTSPTPVSAEVTGLQPNTEYHVRVTASNASGATSGSDVTFTTPGPPLAEGESLSNAGPSSAVVAAQIVSHGSPTAYRVEYGTTEAYGSQTPEVSVGDPASAVGVLVELSDLQPGVEYHFRFVVSNSLGTTLGGDQAFTTSLAFGGTGSKSTLPDDRSYELVSPADDPDASLDIPNTERALGDAENDTVEQPFQAAADGNAVAYVAEPHPTGGNGRVGVKAGGNTYIATRAPGGGWSASDIEVPSTNYNIKAPYQAFSSDLSVAVLESKNEEDELPLAPGISAKYDYLYTRDTATGQFQPLDTGRPARAPEIANQGLEFVGGNAGTGATPSFSHLLFESNEPLTPLAETNLPREEQNQDDLYESVGGQPYLVDVLPNGVAVDNAVLGGPENMERPDFDHAISANGSRIFWTDLEPGALLGHIFARENEEKTIPISVGSASYWDASTDGRYVFYTEAETLWRFDLEGEAGHERDDLAGDGADVQGVVGTSDDGSIVYFVAQGVLAGNKNSRGNEATAGEDNLYVLHVGEPTKFIATLSPVDNGIWGPERLAYGDWQPGLASRTAEVTPDGRHLVFMSERRLTGYNNELGVKEENGPVSMAPSQEIFTYSLDTGDIACASCNPTGVPPQIVDENVDALPRTAGEPFLSLSNNNNYQSRWISEDGSRVFFATPQPLVSTDTNHQQDVYEWEVDGAGSCRLSAGCTYLISGGTSSDISSFIDASASGDDVFFVTRERLVPQVRGESLALYDARVDGVGAPVSPPQCTGTGCQGVPAAPPVFATPSSVTFAGVGNFTAPSVVDHKQKTKSLTTAEKLARALKACKAKRGHVPRATCKRSARKRYQSVKRATKSANKEGN